MRRKFLALMLSAAMIGAMLPTSVLAATEDASEEQSDAKVYSEESETESEEITAEDAQEEKAEDAEISGEGKADDQRDVSISEDVKSRDDSAAEDDEDTALAVEDQKITATVYKDDSYETVLKNEITITLQGEMPVNAVAKAYPVDVEIDDIDILAAYDITIFDEDGEEYEPEEDYAIDVTFDNEEIREALAEDQDLLVYHMDDIKDKPEKIAELPGDTKKAKFSAKHFSIYIVGEDGTLTDEDGEKVDAYTVNLYQWVYNDEDLSDDTKPINTQTVVGDDYVIEPEVPEIANHMFDGWFTEKQDKNHYDDGEYPGYQFDFSKTINENLKTWTDDTVGEGNVINLYSDYDPAYYVYYMTEEKEGFNSDVVFTDVYHVDNPVLNTSNAEALYRSIYASKFVDSWYYYDENNTQQTIGSGETITGDLTIYPVMSDAIWVYFEMGTGDDEKVQAIDPIHIESSATEFGELPEAERAGYEFEGWYTKEGDKVTNETDPQNLVDDTGSITLYAGWTPAAAAYTVNIWRQKATDGQPGIDRKTVQDGEEYSTYINYYDYAESYTVSAEQSQLKTGDTPTTDTVYDWSTWTGYGWNDSSDGAGDYEGFEYNQTRTENNLSTITIQPDGSTIINIFYDRVTVTYRFGSSNNTSMYGTLIGLYDTNTKVADDVESGGTANGWLDPGTNQGWYYSSSLSTSTGMSFLAKFALTENTSHRSNEVDFTRSSTSYTMTLYYYLEVTDPDRQVNASSTTVDIDNVTYVLDQSFSVGSTSRTMTFNFTSKYIGYEFYGYNTNGGTSITTDESSTSVSNGGSLYIFNKAIEYNIELYSNHNGEQLVWSDTYKYGAPLSSVELPDELDAETYGPASWYHFTGTWYEDPTFSAEFQKPDTMPHYNLVAYADWEPNIVTVTFQSNIDSNLYDVLAALYGAENVTTNGTDPWSYSITVTAGDQINYDLDDGLTANVEGHTYQYACWMNTDTNEVFNFMNHIYTDTTLQVFWVEEIEYFLRYNINNEAYAETEAVLGHAHQSSSYAEVRKFTDIFEDISDDGFIRWASEPDGSGDSYYPDDQVDFTRVTSVPVLGEDNEGEQVVKYYAYDLYAVWAGDREVSLTLDYNYPEGYEGEKTENITLDELANLEQVELSEYKPGETSFKMNGFTYTFAGWAYSADAKEAAIDADGTVAADNIGIDEETGPSNILYAVWDAVIYVDVYKYDSTTNEPLENVVFMLWRISDGEEEAFADFTYDEETGVNTVSAWIPAGTALGNYNYQIYTDKEGYIHIAGLEPGDYWLEELDPLKGYQTIEEPISFTINEDGTITSEYWSDDMNAIAIPNDEEIINVRKTDDNGNPLEGAEFVMGRIEQNEINISIPIEGTNYHYEYLTFTEDTETGTYILIQGDGVDTRDEATTLTTDEDGYIHMRELDIGTLYFLVETKAPDGYDLLEDPIVFWVDYDGNMTLYLPQDDEHVSASDDTIMVVDDTETFDVLIYKYDPDRSRGEYRSAGIEPYDVTNYSLEGAEFVLSKEVDSTTQYVVAEKSDDSDYYSYTITGWTDNEDEATALASNLNGYIEITNLEAGTYTLTETKAPEGYNLLEESIVFAVDSEGILSVVSGPAEIDGSRIAVANTEITGAFELDKTDGNNALSGAEFILGYFWEDNDDYVHYYAILNYDEATGTYVLDWNQDSESREDATTLTTGEDGKLCISNLPVSSIYEMGFFLIETKAPEGYDLLENPIVFTVSDDGIIQITVSNDHASMNDDGTVMTVIDDETPNGHLTVTKVVDNEPENGVAYDLGEEIIWKVTVKNDGNLTITNIVLTDEKTGGSWEVGTLEPGEESEAFSTSYTVTEEDIENGSVLNVATATGTSPDPENPDVPVTPGEDEEPTVNPYPSLFVKKTAQVEEGHEAVLGEEITYEITVTNNGNETLKNITVKDTLNGDTWTIDELHPNDSVTFTTVYEVTESDIIAGHVANVATATAPNPNYDPDDPDSPENIEDDDTEDVPTEEPNGHLTVKKEVEGGPENGVAYALGETITWNVTVINDGNLTITDIVVTDEKTGDEWTIESLAPGEESEVFTTIYVVTEDDIENGSVLNVATAKGTSPDPENPDVPVTPGEDEEPSYHYFPLDEEIVPNNDDEEDPDSWVKRESVNEYDAIEIEMSTTLPKVDGSVLAEGDFSMTFHNRLDTALVLDDLESDFKVYIGGKQIDEKYYEIDMIQTNRLLQFFNITDGCAFHVDVDLSALYNDGVIGEEDLGTTPIRVFFYVDLETTDVNSSYVSTAWYDLLSDGEVIYTSDTSTVAVYTFEIIIDKYDTETNDPLADATFGLYYDEACENAVSRNGEDYTATSDENGQAMFVGIAEGTYYAKELEAPKGYALIEGPVEVVLEGDDDDDDDDTEHIVEVSVGNTPSEDEGPKDPVKTADVDAGASVKIGEEINYTISYYNNHNSEATVTITDVLDEGLDYVSSDPAGEYDAAAHTVTWTLTTEAFEEGSVQLIVKVNENAGSEVKNTASVQIDGDPAVDTNEVDIPVEPETTPEPDEPKTPQKSADVKSGASVQVGEEVTYTITYYNYNEEPADVVVTDALDKGLDFVSATDGGSYDADTHTVTWTITDAAAHAEGSVSVTVRVNETAVKKGKITNTATVKIGDADAEKSNAVEIPVTEKGSGTGTPKTGDTNNIGLWLALLIAAIACALVGFRMRKRS